MSSDVGAFALLQAGYCADIARSSRGALVVVSRNIAACSVVWNVRLQH